MRGPLEKLRVIDLTNDLGRFATKLLAETGAQVVRVQPGHGVTQGPPMIDGRAVAGGGLLDWWYDGGKRRLPLDLDREADAQAYRRLAAKADLIIENEPLGRLTALGLDHGDLVGANPALVQVSLTPFGRTGPWARWQTTDLVSSALGGVLSVSGTPEQAINPWGRQSLHFGSFAAAVSGLAAVHHARVSGRGQLVDVSMHEVVATTVEHLWFQYWYDDALPLPKLALRQGALHWLRAYDVTKCKSGWCMISPTPAAPPLLEWMAECGTPGAAEVAQLDSSSVLTHLEPIMAMTRQFALTKDAGELFTEAQARHVAFGEVQSVAQVSANPQFAFRGFIRSTTGAAVSLPRPGHPVVYGSTPLDAPSAPLDGDLEQVLREWEAVGTASPTDKQAPTVAQAPTIPSAEEPNKPLSGLRVLDFTWVLAGPFCCRMLGDLGADIVKVQTAGRATLVNSPEFPYYPCWNRSKRSLSLNMKAPPAIALVRKLVEQSDVLIENYSAGVLDRWGLDYETVHAWNPRLIYVTMSGCGHEGPWKNMISYAPTIHALCGLTHLSNPADRGDVGAGFSLNDHAAGFTAALSILSAIEARRTTGEGQHVDIAQLEVGAYLVGPAVMDYLANRREAQPTGNHDPYASYLVNEVFKTSDGELAITVRDEREGAAVQRLISGDPSGLANWCATKTADAAMRALQGVGVPAGRVQNAELLFNDDEQLAARGLFSTMTSDVFGGRPFDRYPALFSESVLAPYRGAPNYLGEHNFELLSELAGMSEEEIAAAMGDGLLD